MIFRRKPRELHLDEQAYGAWLRAGTPDIYWFLALAPEEQETLARLGDEHRLDTARAIGAAVWEPVAEAADDDHVHTTDGLAVIIPANSVDSMRGATLDLPSVAGQGGLVIRNPNRPNPLGDMGQLELTGDAADKVRVLLAERINPALAAHGGFAELVGVEDDKAFVTMGGGCQGCAMSAATLREGITKAILEAIPEITEVVDTTDHDQGENPYYS